MVIELTVYRLDRLIFGLCISKYGFVCVNSRANEGLSGISWVTLYICSGSYSCIIL